MISRFQAKSTCERVTWFGRWVVGGLSLELLRETNDEKISFGRIKSEKFSRNPVGNTWNCSFQKSNIMRLRGNWKTWEKLSAKWLVDDSWPWSIKDWASPVVLVNLVGEYKEPLFLPPKPVFGYWIQLLNNSCSVFPFIKHTTRHDNGAVALYI